MSYNSPKNSRSHRSRILTSRITFIALAAFALLTIATTSAFMAPPLNGAVFTTDGSCGGTNINIFTDKSNVYLDGGPAHPGAAGLPDGAYYVKVTEPSGALLGTSIGSANETPVIVVSGEFASCYQLSAILIKATDSTPGYDDTTNGGGEYKVWISPDSLFDQQKTDNFKVKPGEPIPPQGDISVIKFYDANANGINDDLQLITGWKVRIQDSIDFIRFTPTTLTVFAPDDYVVTEFSPNESNWIRTTTNPVSFSLVVGQVKTVEFGNLCLGAGNGKTLGFWSNKNGQAAMGGDAGATYLNGLRTGPTDSPANSQFFRDAGGSLKTFSNYAAFRTWILGATATNMAYMLSAQLAAMELNVHYGGQSGGALIYAPGTNSANSLGFATVQAVMDEAEVSLANNGYTVASGATRTYQEALKNALDRANNNLNFVQGTPCPFTF